VAARALRQERGSPRGDENRSHRWPAAVRAVWRQRRMVGVDDPGPQPECRDEAAGAGQGLADEANEGLRFPIGLPGRVVSHARKPIIRLGAGAGALGLIISARQSIRALACGPSGRSVAASLIRLRGYAASHLIGRQCLSMSVHGHRTRGGSRASYPDSPTVQLYPKKRLCRCLTEPKPLRSRKSMIVQSARRFVRESWAARLKWPSGTPPSLNLIRRPGSLQPPGRIPQR
jgi:hypothetical protein